MYFQTREIAQAVFYTLALSGYCFATMKPCRGGWKVDRGFVRMVWE